MNKGKALKKGDKVGLTAPAGPVNAEKLRQAVHVLLNLGYQVEIGLTCMIKAGTYLAGPAAIRAKELNRMFESPDIKAIFCLRGGYGSPQLLDLLEYEMIKENPKLFIGYSDITALHIALQQKSNLATIHGPMPASDLIEADDFTIASLIRAASNPEPYGQIDNPNGEKIGYLCPGEASGILTGGNLSLITATMGTSYEIDTAGRILFLEDIDEEIYKIDRMLNQLALAGKFSNAAGIVLGTWTRCGNKEDTELIELFNQVLAPFRKPVLYNVQAGHCSPMLTLPFGTNAYINAEEGTIVIVESPVC